MENRQLILSVLALTLTLLAACSGSVQNTKLTSAKWNLETLNGAKVTLPEGKIVTLEVNSEKGAVSGKAPCNTYSCSYDEYGEQLKFNVITSTKMACDDLGMESDYYTALGKVTGYKIAGSKLKLYNGSTVIAEFTKAQ
jgi:heat shock protein HslJ